MAKTANASCFPQTKGKVPTGPDMKGKKAAGNRKASGKR